MSREVVDAFLKLNDELDEAIRLHGNDSDEADAVRDKMDRPWYDMTADEQKQVEAVLEKRNA